MIRTFDIETEPLGDDVLLELLPPFDESKYQIAEFDPSSVKTGNLKDPAKKAEKVETERQKHEAEVARLQAECEQDRTNQFANFKKEAALNPVTGRVVVIGLCDEEDQFSYIGDDDERETLKAWWALYQEHEEFRSRGKKHWLAGVNIFNFDLPFLVFRSWVQHVTVPRSAVELESKWCNWGPVFFDIRRAFQLGDNQRKSSFDWMGKAFGTGGKIEGDCGAKFGELWRSDRATALRYLKNDVRQPMQWLVRMGVSKTTAFSERIDF
jgi:hypothetical protein